MPNFDGTGPLKRGRAIGRGRGFCREQPVTGSGREPEEKNPVHEKKLP